MYLPVKLPVKVPPEVDNFPSSADFMTLFWTGFVDVEESAESTVTDEPPPVGIFIVTAL